VAQSPHRSFARLTSGGLDSVVASYLEGLDVPERDWWERSALGTSYDWGVGHEGCRLVLVPAPRNRPYAHVLVLPPVSTSNVLQRPSAGGRHRAARSPTKQLRLQGVGVLSSTALNAVLGIAFWLLAARYAHASAVALALAAQSWLILLSMAAQLNIGTALSRFLPPAGPSQGAIIAWAYRVSIAMTTLAALIVLALSLGGVELIRGAAPSLVILLAVSLPLWAAFSLQDSVLIACRRSTWLPWENGFAALLRLALVIPLARAAGAAGILLAFVLPAVPMTAVVSWLIARRLAQRGGPLSPPGSQVLRYSLAGFPGSLATMASLRLVPVFMLAFQQPQDAAFVGVPWSVLSVALLTLPALSRAFLAELSAPGTEVDALLHRVHRMLLVGLGPLCLVGAVSAPLVLAVAGRPYAEHGGPVLATGILALVPAAATEARLALLRYQGRPGSATIVQGIRAAVLLVAVLILAKTGDLELLGVALLAATVVGWFAATRFRIQATAG
jgi:O-antigen/teichoic acid export membrane protein